MADDSDIPDASISQDQQKAVNSFLLLAVKEYNYERINLTLQKGADINTRDDSGYTPLMLAVNLNHPYMVQFILDKNPDLFQRDNWKRTAFDLIQNSRSRDEILNSMLKALPDHIRKAAATDEEAVRMAAEEARQKKPAGIEAPQAASFRQKPKGFNP